MEKEPQSNSPEEQNNCIENRLSELRDYIKKMERENEELYTALGMSPHQAQEILNDKSRLSEEAFEFIQRERRALEDILENRIEEVRASFRKEHPDHNSSQKNSSKTPPGGHWVLMR